jgi:hypothetical protein
MDDRSHDKQHGCEHAYVLQPLQQQWQQQQLLLCDMQCNGNAQLRKLF